RGGRRRPHEAVPEARARHDRRGVRRLGEGERRALRRSGHLRPDLPAGQEVGMRRRSALPGFGLSLGFSLSYLGLLVLIPLATLFLRSAGLSWERFWDVAGSPRALAAYRLTFGASAVATLVNAV